MYFENDLEGLKQEIKENFLINYIEDKNFKQNLIKRQSEIDEQLKMILKNEKSKKVKFTNFVKLYQLRSYITKLLHKKDKNEFSDSERIKILSKFKLILSLANELAKNNSELYFVYLPSYERYVSLNYDHTNYNQVKNIINDLNVNFIDIHKEALKEANPLKNFPFELFGHYNVTGYKKVSDAIYRLSNSR